MKIKRRHFITLGFIGGIAALILDSFWFELYCFEVKSFILNNSNLKKIKALQISDLHLNTIRLRQRALIDKIGAINPDLLLLTGDVIDKSANLELLDNFLSQLDNNLEKVAILGNWEYWGEINLKDLQKIYTKNNCTLLINDSKNYRFENRTISITGMDDFVGGMPDISKALINYSKSNYHIVLNHCPEYTTQIAHRLETEIPVDLILSGHTHGGQINILGKVPFLPQGCGEYLSGWYKDNFKNLYVSKGFGTSILPIRLGARAEIAVFHI